LKKRIEKLDEILTKERATLANQPSALLKLYRQTHEFYFKKVRSFVLMKGRRGCDEMDEDCDDDADDDAGQEYDDDEDVPMFKRKELARQQKVFDNVWDDDYSSRKFLSSTTSSSRSSSSATAVISSNR
jgi:hypothetical protein